MSDKEEILLSQGKVTIVDKEMEHLRKWKWYFNNNGYAARNIHKENGKQGTLLMHHVVIGFPPGKLEIDHINGNGLDNRKENLRIVSHRENLHNQKCHRGEKKKSSIYHGVYFKKRDKKWVAQITIENKYKYLGAFHTQEEAFEKYKLAENEGIKNGKL